MKKIAILLFMIFIYPNSFAQQWLENLPDGKTQAELTLPDYKNAFDTYWEPFNVDNGYYLINGEKQKAYGWKQFNRWYYNLISKVEVSKGEFPNKSAQQVYDEFIRANPDQVKSKSANWVSLGTNSSTGGYAGVGRINCIAFHPTNNNIYWVGAPAGGLWKTTDNGSSWICLTDDNAVLGVSDIVIPSDYSTSKIIYIATGDKDAWDNRSIGVLKSTDGGTNWSTTDLQFSLSEGKMVTRLLIDPTDNQTLIAATNSGVFKTTNGGDDWSNQLTTNSFIDMEYKPSDFSVLYGSTQYGKIYMSANGGSSWSNVFDNGNRIELAVSPANSNYVYALVSSSNNGLYGVYRSTNSGANFSQMTGSSPNLLDWYDGSYSGGQGWYDLSLAVAPGDANTVLVGGINTWKSTNGGSNWYIVNHWYGGEGVQAVHADKHQLKYRSNGDLFECNDGGIYFSNNNGASGSWVDKTNGMVISQMYKLGVSQTVADETITGLQDNGTKLRSGGAWFDVKGGDGMECLIDYTDVNIQYGTYVRGQISRTTNHWASSVDIEPSAAGDGAWVTPYIIDPVDHNTLYAGYADVWKTTNKGNSWTKISTMSTSSKIRSMAIAPSNTSVLYVADTYHLWKTTNGGNSWTDVTGTLANYSNITNIAIKDNDPNIVWVTLSGYNSYNIYQTINGGSSWVNISDGLPELPTYSVVQNTQITNEVHLYLATELGVYLKKGTSSWIAYNSGLPNVRTAELEIYYDANPTNSKLRLATYGRGLWESNLESQNGNSNPVVINPIDDVSLDEGFGTHSINFSSVFNDPDGDPLSYSVVSSNTSVVGASLSGTTLTITENTNGYSTITLTAADGNGGSVNDVFTVSVSAVFCDPPINLTAEDIVQDGHTATLNWEMGSSLDEFRYDDGTAIGQLGFQTGTTNSVLGSVHPIGAELNEMSWYLTDENGPHASVTLYVMGLDGNGLPDENNVLFTASVSSTDEVWNTYTFANAIIGDDGFFLGVAYDGFVALGTDDGVDAPYTYASNTHYYSFDYPAGEWTTWESSDFEVNGMIRAMGVQGAVNSYDYSNSITEESIGLEYIAMENPVNTEIDQTRDLSGYNVYRDGTKINTSLVSGTTYDDPNAVGFHCYKVTAVYSDCGESDFSNEACVEIESDNSAPIVINPISDVELDEGFGTLTINISNVFDDPDGDALTYTVSSSNTSVIVPTLSGNSLILAEAGIGSATITVTAADDNGGTISDVFIVNVNAAANNPPTVVNPIADVDLDEGFGTHTINISNVFDDPDGDALTYTVSSSNTSVIVPTLSGNSLFLAEAGIGSATITLTADDGNGETVNDVFLITVNAASNNPPTVENPISDVELNEGFGTYNIDISIVFDDPDGDALSYSISGSNSAVVIPTVSGNTLFLVETGIGVVIITLTADDDNGGIVSDEFNVTVNAAGNNPPTVENPISDVELDEGFDTYNIDISDVFEDPDSDELSYSISSSNQSVVIPAISGNTIFLVETGIGVATITLTADDGNGGTVNDEFLVTVFAVNDSPIIINPIADVELDEGFGTYNIDISNVFEDPDGDVLSYSVFSSNTSVIVPAVSGNYLILAEIGTGSATITLTADDGNGETVNDVFLVTVNAVNNPPIVINPIPDVNLDEGFGTHNIDISNVFDDTDGDNLSYSVNNSNTSVITTSLTGNTLLLTEVGIGVTIITVTASDGNGGTVNDEFIITVNAAGNNPPIVINPISDVELDDGFGTYNIGISTVFNDPDGDALTYIVSSSNTSVVVPTISGNILTIVEVGPGSAAITLTADDGNGGAISDVFVVTVNPPVNIAPIVINPISDVDLEEGFSTHNISIANVFYDSNGDELNYTVSCSNISVIVPTISGNTLILVETGTGHADIILTANDGNGGTAQNEFHVFVDELDFINELNITDINIHPNPSTGLIYISIANYSKLVDLSVYNLLGELITEKLGVNNENLSLDLSNNESGVYFVKIATDDDAFVKRVVIK